ncbi:MAG: hypothetical protein AAGB18_07280 [Pseudomonadota bacterium]
MKIPRPIVAILAGLAQALAPALAEGAGKQVSAAEARTAGETLARWALDQSEPDILAAAIELSLLGGAALDPEDPWTVAGYIEELSAISTEVDHLAAFESMVARGVVAGTSRSELTLAPGQTETLTLRMADGERALIEARQKRGPNGADLDLRVLHDGGILAEALGPETGTPDVGALVFFTPSNCIDVVIELSNAGTTTANAVLLAPASSRLGCGD